MSKISLRDLDVAISTVDRPKNYIHKVLARLPKDLPFRLIVGSPSYDYLKRYRQISRIEIIGVDPEEWDRFKNYKVAHRASWNYWRCFVHGKRPGNRKGLLILEDDVLPARGWQERFIEAVNQIGALYGEDCVLSLYTNYPWLANSATQDGYYRRYPAHMFLNTQAMYYPEAIRVAFAEYLKTEGVESFRTHYDRLLSDYLRSTGTPLFVTTPSLFQHIGEITTGLSPGFHRARSFAKDSPRKSRTSKRSQNGART